MMGLFLCMPGELTPLLSTTQRGVDTHLVLWAGDTPFLLCRTQHICRTRRALENTSLALPGGRSGGSWRAAPWCRCQHVHFCKSGGRESRQQAPGTFLTQKHKERPVWSILYVQRRSIRRIHVVVDQTSRTFLFSHWTALLHLPLHSALGTTTLPTAPVTLTILDTSPHVSGLTQHLFLTSSSHRSGMSSGFDMCELWQDSPPPTEWYSIFTHTSHFIFPLTYWWPRR